MHYSALNDMLGRLAFGGAIDNYGNDEFQRQVGRETLAVLHTILQYGNRCTRRTEAWKPERRRRCIVGLRGDEDPIHRGRCSWVDEDFSLNIYGPRGRFHQQPGKRTASAEDQFVAA